MGSFLEGRVHSGMNARSNATARIKVIVACSHEFGAQLITALALDPILSANIELVYVFTDDATKWPGKRPVWENDAQFVAERQMIARTVKSFQKSNKLSPNLQVSNRIYSDDDMHQVIDRTGAKYLLSATYHGIFGASVLERVRGFNFHPSGWQENLGRYIPIRYRGKHAARTIIKDIECGRIPAAVVGLHQLVARVESGVVAAWSNPARITLSEKIPAMISEEQQQRMWAQRMSVFQKQVAPHIFSLAQAALPYHLGVTSVQPSFTIARETLNVVQAG